MNIKAEGEPLHELPMHLPPLLKPSSEIVGYFLAKIITTSMSWNRRFSDFLFGVSTALLTFNVYMSAEPLQ